MNSLFVFSKNLHNMLIKMKISEFHILSSLLFSHYTYILFLSFYIIFVKTVIVNSCRPYYTFKIMLTKPVFSTYFATTKHENPPFLWLYISFCISCDHYACKILINFTTRIIKWQIFLTRKLYWFPALTFFSNICILCSMHKCFFFVENHTIWCTEFVWDIL